MLQVGDRLGSHDGDGYGDAPSCSRITIYILGSEMQAPVSASSISFNISHNSTKSASQRAPTSFATAFLTSAVATAAMAICGAGNCLGIASCGPACRPQRLACLAPVAPACTSHPELLVPAARLMECHPD